MLDVKFKDDTKFKTYGKCDLLRKRLYDEVESSSEHKMDYRAYMNEVFAGLIWLG